jgi:hypothetical protein
LALHNSSRQREFSRKKGKWRITMTGLKRLVAAALISTFSATSAFAQAAISEPAAFQAMYPNRDVLNGGALIGSTASNAYAGMASASSSSCAQRYHSYDPATATFLGHDGRRHQCR